MNNPTTNTNSKLTPEEKKLWIDALKSGKYKQCRGMLCGYIYDDATNQYIDVVGHCCIGVFAKVIIPNHKLTPGANHDDDVVYDALITRVGNAHQETLLHMNDSQRLDFKTIAKWIKDNL